MITCRLEMRASLLLALCGFIFGCGGPSPTATKNRTFYDWAVATGEGDQLEFEQRYPPLDLAEQPPNPVYIGVTVLRGGVRLSKPGNWKMRDAGNVAGQAYLVTSRRTRIRSRCTSGPDSAARSVGAM